MVATRRISRSIFAISLLLFLLGLGWVSQAALSDPNRGPRDYNWERIQANREIIIGIDPSLPPFGAYDGEEIIGLDPALGNALAEKLGLHARFVVLGFDGLYDTLLLGYADVIIAALRPDPLRGDRVRYTNPYFDAGHVLVSYEGYQTLNDLIGKRVAVEFASEGDLVARQLEDLTITRYFTAEEALMGLEQGEVEAALVDRVSFLLYSSVDLVASPPLISDPYVIAIRRNDWRLYQALQAALLDLVVQGELDQLIQRWVQAEK